MGGGGEEGKYFEKKGMMLSMATTGFIGYGKLKSELKINISY